MALQKNPENPAWDPEEMEKEIPVMVITIGDLSEECIQDISSSYEGNTNTRKILKIMSQENPDLSFITTLEQPWKSLHQEESFHYFQGCFTLEKSIQQ